MSQYFITGIHTGIGKTLVTAALAYQLTQAGQPVRAIKPILSGYHVPDPSADDSAVLLEASGYPVTQEQIAAITPWRFAAPVSPHLAAKAEGRTIDFNELQAFCKQHIKSGQTTLIEGVGGLLVPINEEAMILDLIMALESKVILVASSYLGAINHTLLTLHALAMAMIEPAAIIVSQAAQDDAGLENAVDAIVHYGRPACPVVPLPRISSTDKPWKNAPNLLSLVL